MLVETHVWSLVAVTLHRDTCLSMISLTYSLMYLSTGFMCLYPQVSYVSINRFHASLSTGFMHETC
jgi:hypothetical protein